MTISYQSNNSFHKRLMENRCPKCEQVLQVTEKTEEKLVRVCKTCTLTIIDDPKTAEFPKEICD